jgi:hypothetical protein
MTSTKSDFRCTDELCEKAGFAKNTIAQHTNAGENILMLLFLDLPTN